MSNPYYPPGFDEKVLDGDESYDAWRDNLEIKIDLKVSVGDEYIYHLDTYDTEQLEMHLRHIEAAIEKAIGEQWQAQLDQERDWDSDAKQLRMEQDDD